MLCHDVNIDPAHGALGGEYLAQALEDRYGVQRVWRLKAGVVMQLVSGYLHVAYIR